VVRLVRVVRVAVEARAVRVEEREGLLDGQPEISTRNRTYTPVAGREKFNVNESDEPPR